MYKSHIKMFPGKLTYR